MKTNPKYKETSNEQHQYRAAKKRKQQFREEAFFYP